MSEYSKSERLAARIQALTEENARLRERLARREQRSTVVARIGSRIRSTPDLSQILQAVTEEIGLAVDATWCRIALEVDLPLLPAVFEYLAPNAPSSVEIPAGARNDAQHSESAHITVPIMLRHEVLGTIDLERQGRQAWMSDEIEMVSHTAGALAMLLANARLLVENQRRAREIDRLQAVAQMIIEEPDPHRLAERLAEQALALVDAEQAMVGLVVGEAVVVERLCRHERWERVDLRFRPGEGVAGWVLEHGRPYRSDDADGDPRVPSNFVRRFACRTVLAVPILSRHQHVLGVIELHNRRDGEPFADEDTSHVQAIAHQAAVALERAQLFEEMQQRGEQLRALSAQLVTILEDERRRIAHELHDEAGQALVGIKLNLQVLARKIPVDLPELQEDIVHLRQQVNDATDKLHTLSRGLRPPTLEELGLAPALHRLTADFEQNTGITIHFEAGELPDRLSRPVEIACYRIVQESLTNVARHANADCAWITLALQEQALCLSVRDEGRGFDPAGTPPAGLGLLGMRERATMLGGKLTVDASPGKGTRIRATIPLVSADHPDDNGSSASQ